MPDTVLPENPQQEIEPVKIHSLRIITLQQEKEPVKIEPCIPTLKFDNLQTDGSGQVENNEKPEVLKATPMTDDKEAKKEVDFNLPNTHSYLQGVLYGCFQKTLYTTNKGAINLPRI